MKLRAFFKGIFQKKSAGKTHSWRKELFFWKRLNCIHSPRLIFFFLNHGGNKQVVYTLTRFYIKKVCNVQAQTFLWK